jgi:hypothetical protein
MSGFLLDTNVLSEFNRRGGPDQRVKPKEKAAWGSYEKFRQVMAKVPAAEPTEYDRM